MEDADVGSTQEQGVDDATLAAGDGDEPIRERPRGPGRPRKVPLSTVYERVSGRGRGGGRKFSLEEPIYHGYSGLFLFIAIMRQEPHWRIPESDAKEFAHHLDAALYSIRRNAKWLQVAEKYAPWLTVAGVGAGHVVSRVLESNRLRYAPPVPLPQAGTGPSANGTYPSQNGISPHDVPLDSGRARGFGETHPGSDVADNFTPSPEAVQRAARFRMDLEDSI